jgi:uncharacterized membrane protein
MTTSTHCKGFDFFSSTTYALGSDALIAALTRFRYSRKSSNHNILSECSIA